MKKLTRIIFANCIPAWLFASPEKPNFQDDVMPIFEQSCNSCHNPDKAKGGLDLTSVNAILAGGSSGEVALSEEPEQSLLYLLPARLQEPFMPPRGDKIESSQLLILKNWIAQGMLPTASGKPMKKKKTSVNLALGSFSIGKPEGPPPMPKTLNLEPHLVTARPFAPSAMATANWSPLVALAGQKQVLLFNSDNLRLSGVLSFEEGFIESLNFSRNGKLLIASGGRGGKSGLVVGWEVETGKRVMSVGEEQDSILTADISADQTLVAIGATNKLVKVFDLASNEVLYKIKKHSEWVTQVSFSPDGILLATGDRNGGIHIWEARTGNPFYTLSGHQGEISDLSWRADGNILLSASEDGTLRTWEMINGKQVKSWTAHADGVLSAQIDLKSNIVSSGRDKTAKLWDGNGKAIRTISGFKDIVIESRLSHDGSKVIAADWLGNVSVWSAKEGKSLGSLNPNPPTISDRIKKEENDLQNADVSLQKAKKNALPFLDATNRFAQLVSEEKKKLEGLKIGLLDTEKKYASYQAKYNTTKLETEKLLKSIGPVQVANKENGKQIVTLNTDASNQEKKVAELTHQQKEISNSISLLRDRYQVAIEQEKESNSSTASIQIKRELDQKNLALKPIEKKLLESTAREKSIKAKVAGLQKKKLESTIQLKQLQAQQKEAQAGQDKALASLKSFEALISKHKDSMIQSKKLLEKHTHQWTDAKKSLTEPLQSRKQAEERVALHTKQLQRWQAEQINTKRHLELLALQEMQTDLEFLNEELEEAKNIFSTAQIELDEASGQLHDLPNQISMAREELQAKQNELQSKKLDLEKMNQKLAKQKALITKTELLSKESKDHTGTGQENATLLDANKDFDQALKLLKKDLLQISAELNKQNERITFTSNQCKLAEEHLSQSLSLRNKIPGIIEDKKILFDDSETARVNKETEMKKLESLINTKRQITDQWYQDYLSALPEK
ncbi:MAG: c-type cytochrome domain-containing protein [Opitutales bacterium]